MDMVYLGEDAREKWRSGKLKQNVQASRSILLVKSALMMSLVSSHSFTKLVTWGCEGN